MYRTHTTSSEAYLGVLKDVRDNYEFKCAPRGFDIREITDYMFTITNPTLDPIVTKDLKRNKVIAKYYEKERELYDSCSNSVEDFAAASKFWQKLANPDGTVNSAYGYLIWKNRSMGNKQFSNNRFMTPWEWAVESLKRDKDTRQAFVKFSLPEHQWLENKDQTCTLHGNFHIREDKLYLTIVMRSNDVTLGLIYDVVWFISLMEKMRKELLSLYPDLEIGTYTHIAHSMHMYERDLDKINKTIG